MREREREIARPSGVGAVIPRGRGRERGVFG